MSESFKILGNQVNAANFGPETFNPNTGINSASHISIASQRFVNGTPIVYFTSAGNTTPTGLTSGQSYYAVYADGSGLGLSLTSGGANLVISNSGPSETGHTLMGMNTLGASQVRVFNDQGVKNSFHVVNSSGYEIANLTLANNEVIFLHKNTGDSIYSNGSMLTLPISYRG